MTVSDQVHGWLFAKHATRLQGGALDETAAVSHLSLLLFKDLLLYDRNDLSWIRSIQIKYWQNLV